MVISISRTSDLDRSYCMQVHLLLIALVVGLIVSIFQATTQIQEQTLAFVPKIVAVLVRYCFFGPWMISQVTSYACRYF